jgi:hypothetical protein
MTPSGLLGNKTLRTLLKVINHLPGRYILVHQFKLALAVKWSGPLPKIEMASVEVNIFLHLTLDITIKRPTFTHLSRVNWRVENKLDNE